MEVEEGEGQWKRKRGEYLGRIQRKFTNNSTSPNFLTATSSPHSPPPPPSSPLSSNSAPEVVTSSPTSFDFPLPNSPLAPSSPSTFPSSSSSISQMKIFSLLQSPHLQLKEMQNAAWGGISPPLRPTIWKILLGYTATNKERREQSLDRKREEYVDLISLYHANQSDSVDESIHHQIKMDIERTQPSSPLFRRPSVQIMLIRVIYIWAVRHPASGYIQGMNDLITPFFLVFLTEYFPSLLEEKDGERKKGSEELYDFDVDIDQLNSDDIMKLESDCFWCFSRLLDALLENYTFAQIGIQRMIYQLELISTRIDGELSTHLNSRNLKFLIFSYRWMNCLLIRELPISLIIRMWDTYLSEYENNICDFHVYVCLAFLIRWQKEVKNLLEFSELIQFLQHLPTSDWTEKDIELMLAQSHLYRSLYYDAPGHLVSSAKFTPL